MVQRGSRATILSQAPLGLTTGPAVFEDAFKFVIVPLPPGEGSGGGSGLSFSQGDRLFGADFGPDPGG